MTTFWSMLLKLMVTTKVSRSFRSKKLDKWCSNVNIRFSLELILRPTVTVRNRTANRYYGLDTFLKILRERVTTKNRKSVAQALAAFRELPWGLFGPNRRGHQNGSGSQNTENTNGRRSISTTHSETHWPRFVSSAYTWIVDGLLWNHKNGHERP